jgi:platelet-activating factor acetylhydrolase IB subunit alpha
MSIRVWELSTGYCIHAHVGGHGDWIRSIDVSPNGEMIASCSSDQMAKVWRLETVGTTSATVTEIVSLRDHDHVVECVAFSNAAADLTLRKLMRINGGSSSVEAAAAAVGGGDGTETKSSGAQKQERRNAGGQFVVTGSRDRTVRVWHVATGSSVCVFRDHENWVRCVKFHASGHVVLSVAEDRTIRAIDLKEGRKAVRTISDAHTHFLTSCDLHPNGTSMVTGSVDKTLRCWSLK